MYFAFSVHRMTQGESGVGVLAIPLLFAVMTDALFRTDAYLRECSATVRSIGPQGIVLDRTVFYPTGGAQAGDAGVLVLASGAGAGRSITIVHTRKGKDEQGRVTTAICHLPQDEAQAALLAVGDRVTARIDWERRHRLMRFHTATHLLCHLVPQPVDGCSITPGYARLDFHMTDPLDKAALGAALAALVEAGHPVQVGAVSDAELDANPALVRSMSVQPPRGSGSVRTIRIGAAQQIDLQPCGGTHVANTREIGAVLVTKIEKKSASTRRVVLGFADQGT